MRLDPLAGHELTNPDAHADDNERHGNTANRHPATSTVDDPNDNPESIVVADLDNDGRAEIIVGMINSNRVLVYGHVQ